MGAAIQVPSLILPTSWILGTEVETMNDVVVHTSIDIPLLEFTQEKTIHILATEVFIAGAAGNLQFTVQLSPYPSTISTAYFATLGVPTVIVPTNVMGTVHTTTIAWTTHSPYARLLAQMPVCATPLTSYFVVQALISAKG